MNSKVPSLRDGFQTEFSVHVSVAFGSFAFGFLTRGAKNRRSTTVDYPCEGGMNLGAVPGLEAGKGPAGDHTVLGRGRVVLLDLKRKKAKPRVNMRGGRLRK